MQVDTRLVCPELPAPSEWLPYLQPALDANWHTNFGPVCRAFEARLTETYGRDGETTVAVNNATGGLSACLIAANITGPVLCPAFTFQATAAAILGANCTPVVIDCSPDTGVISARHLDAALRDTGAKAAIVLSPYGIATDFRDHAAVCAQHDALLVIDNAAGLGIDRTDPATSAQGANVREVFSLHATKPFGIGEGGAVFLPSKDRAALESAINFGLPSHTGTGQNSPPYWGINAKMPEVAAAIGLAVADTMAARITARQDMARRWHAALKAFPLGFFASDPALAPWQCFPVLLPDQASRDRLKTAVETAGIELRNYYSPSLGACRGMQRFGDCANAADLSARVIVFPMRSFMPLAEQVTLIDTVVGCMSESLQ